MHAYVRFCYWLSVWCVYSRVIYHVLICGCVYVGGGCLCASCKNGCYIGRGQTVCDHTESSSGRSTPPWFTAFWGGSLIFSQCWLHSVFFLLIVRALILDQLGLLLDRKCFMLVKIIALSFPTHKIAFVIRWGMYLLRQSLSRQSDGNSFN